MNHKAPVFLKFHRTGHLLLLLFLSSFSQASDWPQFLGPTRNGVYAGNDLAAEWPKDGPPVLWQKQVGQGFGGPVAASNKLILFHRVDDKETVECLEARNGKSLWTFAHPTSYRDDFGFDEGPRSTPAISENRVFTYGAEGVLNCVDFNTGKQLWTVNAKSQFRAPKGFFGIACSPLVEGNSVLLIVGGRDGAGIVAFDRLSGKTLWKATSDEASYSSPIATTIGDRHYALFLTRSALVGLASNDGKILFRFPFQPSISSSVTAATPLISDDLVLLSASYGAGATLLKIRGTTTEKIWASDDLLSSHYTTPVLYKGFVYGIHGRTDPSFHPAALRCIELKTGKLAWEQPSFGAATIILAGDELLLLTERGELVRAPASSTQFKVTGRAQVLGTQVRAHPALADGLLYARSKDKLVCIDLRAKAPNR